jgi:hypothetical protein
MRMDPSLSSLYPLFLFLSSQIFPHISTTEIFFHVFNNFGRILTHTNTILNIF